MAKERANFIIPRGSKAIRIVSPGESTAPGETNVQQHRPQSRGKHDAADQQAAPASSSDIPKSNHAIAIERTRVAPSTIAPEIFHEKEVERAFDVYAHAYIPESLRIMNEIPPAQTFTTHDRKQIPFVAYVQSFTPPPLYPLPRRVTNLVDDFTYSTKSSRLALANYEAFFRHFLQEEFFARSRQNDANKLFSHPANWHAQSSCLRVDVPGLREDDPLLFAGDAVELRQLRLDPRTGLPLMRDLSVQGSMPTHRGDLQYYHYAPGFDGVQYNACVEALLRNSEQVILRVEKFFPGSLKFNVMFPVAQKHYIVMAEALALIQERLEARVASTEVSAATGEIGQYKITSPHPPSSSTSSLGLDVVSRNWLQSMLFPQDSDGVMQTELSRKTSRYAAFDKNLNYEQLKAVHTITDSRYGDVPFLISGPPGTGKTKTLVETALQLLKSSHHESILVCAPSDAAADTLAQRLSLHLRPDQMFRLNAPARTFAEVPDYLLQYCHVFENMFTIPEFAKLMTYEVVVTTCRDSSILLSARVTNEDLYNLESGISKLIHPKAQESAAGSMHRLHWTALLIDEAAQAMEPEALIPLSIVAPHITNRGFSMKPQFIMAGDEYQLGPRTASRLKELRTSLYTRLFSLPMYQNHPLARSKTQAAVPMLTREMLPVVRAPFANLIRNYRSHPSILAIPSSLFYHDSLVPEASETDSMCGWDGWKGRKWPVLFIKNGSPDEREQDGGGWYNVGEVEIACQLAQNLVGSGLIAPEDICIMSPFSAQVQHLRKVIRSPRFGLWKVNIGPTEAYQGLERRVVIMCTTRSKLRFLQEDISLSRGLVKQGQRMNVALTRAKHGLFVIGNPSVLREDNNWRSWISFCARNGLEDDSHYSPDLEVKEEGGWEEKPDKIPPTPRDEDDRPILQTTRLERVLIMKEEGGLDMHTSRARGWGYNKDEAAQADEAWAQAMAAEQVVLEESSILEQQDSDDYEYKQENGAELTTR